MDAASQRHNWEHMVAERSTAATHALRLLSWNLWFGGAEINDGRVKQAQFVRGESADVVFVQECFGDGGAELSRSCGTTIAQAGADTAVLTNAPVRLLRTDTEPYATAALIDSRIGTFLAWSVHFAPHDYGPYRRGDLPAAAEEVLATPGEQMRTEQSAQVLAETARLTAELATADLPVVIAGDFNVPTAADWDGTAKPRVDWPATAQLIDAGFVDAFRAIHPDPVRAPGITWSPIEPIEIEPRDRIDFIYVRGFNVVAAEHIGGSVEVLTEPGFRAYPGTCRFIPDHRDNAFASDHHAVAVHIEPVQGGR